MPANPAFQKVNIPQVSALAKRFDTESYDISDADWAKRFPLLKKGREYAIDNAGRNLRGEQDPLLTDTLARSGLGGVNFGNTAFKQAKNMGQPILAKEQRDRNYFARLLGNNPQRAFGLSGQDVAHIALANTGGQNVYNQGVYQSRINQYNASVQQEAQNYGALIGALGSLGSAGIKAYNSPYLSVSGYGSGGGGKLGNSGGMDYYGYPTGDLSGSWG